MLKLIRELNITTSDRTYVPLGSSNISTNGSFLRCSAEQPSSSSLAAPSVIWLKDGTQLSGDGVRVNVTTTNTTMMGSNRTLSFVRIFNFSQSDAGVYQCVFYDTPSQGGEVITTRPYKVDTGYKQPNLHVEYGNQWKCSFFFNSIRSTLLNCPGPLISYPLSP